MRASVGTVICQIVISESLRQRLLYVSVENLCINSRLSMPNEFVWVGATGMAGPGIAATGEPWPSRERGTSDVELGGVRCVVARRAAATFKYVHFNSRVVQFEHGGPCSSHLTRLLLH